jgi:Asp-tRNA(Asn)/Glu-tRNA(Gln) amidotransferase A subunit family amidase
MDFRTESVVDLASQVRAQERSAVELTEHALERIEALNPACNAFVALDADGARAQAAAIDARLARGERVGPLAGIPIGVKDLEAAAGFVTTKGSALHADDAPATEDSTVVARLRAAGCVVLGKTNTPEHGWMADTTNAVFGPTRNPWDLDRSPGGSSGGTAAALASGMVPLATGSDGGGSIRIPAALCGLNALKPSQGRVPNGGSRAPGSGLLGVKAPMTMRVRDQAYALDVVFGQDPLDPFSLPRPTERWYDVVATPGPVAARLPRQVLWAPTMGYDVDREVLGVCEAAVRSLEAAGTEVVTIDEVFSDDPVMTFLTIWSIMRLRDQGPCFGTPDWDRIDPGLRAQMVYAKDHFGPTAFAHALDDCYRYSAELATVFEQAPILLSPTVAGQTPRVGGHQGTIDGDESLTWVRFTYPFNLTRYPAGSVNAGFTGDGMPVGLQVVGRHLADVEVLAMMAHLEDLLPLDRLAPG